MNPTAPDGAATRRLLAYHRIPSGPEEANNADIALSMHLALDGPHGWEPLFDNYGILFARVAAEPGPRGTDDEVLRSLVDPHVFALHGGGYGVVATRVRRGGAPDGTEASSVLVATSHDLRSYDEVGLLDLGVTDGVHRPAAVYDAERGMYVIAWTSTDGRRRHTTVRDLAEPATRGPVVDSGVDVPGADADAAGVDGCARGSVIEIPAPIARGLEIRFGPVRNTGARPWPGVEVAVGTTLAVDAFPERVTLDYDDGSTGSLAVDWDVAAIARIDTSEPGSHLVTGEVIQPVYPTPFADERADPSIVPFDLDGEPRFLMVATKDLHMDPVSNSGEPVGLPLRVATRIEDLSDEALAAGRTVEIDLLSHGSLDAHGRPMTGCFWAPELHVIAGTLSMLMMPSYGDPTDMWTGRASIMQLRTGADGRPLDPADPGGWTAPREVRRADGSALNHLEGISLDMTYVEDSGTSYYCWQMLGAVFIATMDPARPDRLTSEPVRIVAPEYAWDNVIAEGPNILERDGRLHLLYSGSSVGDTYTTGLATAPAGVGADLADPATWDRLGHPIQKSGPYNGQMQVGTGHGMWSADERGNLLYVFHARTDHLGLTGRDTFVRRVHWAADGLPVLDMETDEELLPAFRTVQVNVRVVPRGE